MLDLSGIQTAYPVIVQTRKFRHALWIDTPAGNKFFDAVRHSRCRRSLRPYRSTNPRRSPGSVKHAKDMGGRVGCTGAMEPGEVFFVKLVPSFVSKIVLCGRERWACVEENGSVWRVKGG